MDIIAQLQEQASKIAYLAFNTVGTLQRDAPPAQLSADYPNPPAVPAETVAAVAEQPKVMAAALVQAVKQFDALVAALPIAEGGEEVQCKRIAELQVYIYLTQNHFAIFLIRNFCMHQANGFYNSKCAWLIPLVCQRAYRELMELRMCVVG
jgi:hypothetical protein